MTEASRCPQCGAELPVNAPEGLCPRCPRQQGIEDGNADPSTAFGPVLRYLEKSRN
jgi:hypothetical protein